MRIWISELVDRKWRHSQVRAVFELSYTTNMRYFVKQTISFPFISDHVFEIQFLKFEDFKYATWNWWLTYGHGNRFPGQDEFQVLLSVSQGPEY